MDTESNKQLKAIDFFSGAGGLTYGLGSAGIKVIAGIDIDESCKATYERNNSGSIFLSKDMTEYGPEELARELSIQRNDDNLIFAGCAPCQFWTIINTSKKKSGETKDLIWEFQRFIHFFLPGYIIVENVPGISSKKDSPMRRFIRVIESLGYYVAYDIIDMSLYGIPQRRKRFTLMASRVSYIDLPEANHKIFTVRDVIGEQNGFPRINAGARDRTRFLHTTAGLSSKNLSRLKMTKHDGGDRSVWQNIARFQLPCYSTPKQKFYDTYGRMWWDRPAPTITTKFLSISNGRFAHPEENRALSLREGATLQTFPKKYEFVGTSLHSIARMIGNAVPPKFAKILGQHLIKLAN